MLFTVKMQIYKFTFWENRSNIIANFNFKTSILNIGKNTFFSSTNIAIQLIIFWYIKYLSLLSIIYFSLENKFTSGYSHFANGKCNAKKKKNRKQKNMAKAKTCIGLKFSVLSKGKINWFHVLWLKVLLAYEKIKFSDSLIFRQRNWAL